MKTKLLLISSLAGLLMAASCTREPANVEAPADGSKVTVLSAELPTTKTVLGTPDGSTYPILWETGNIISVNGVSSDALASEYNGLNSAQFSFASEITEPYYAFSPASAVKSYTAGTAVLVVPTEQTWVDGSYDPSAFILKGSGSGGGISFSETPLAVLEVVPTQKSVDTKIASVTLKALGDVPMSGELGAAAVDGTAAFDYVTMSAASPVELGKSWFISIPAKRYASGLEITIYDEDGKAMRLVSKDAFTAEAGKIQTTKVPYAPNGKLVASAAEVSSSTLSFTWTWGMGVDYDISRAYTFGLYNDSACTDLVKEFTTAASQSCWSYEDVFFTPKFTFGNLDSGRPYYFKVSCGSDESNVVSASTTAFSPVSVPDAVLATDASDIVILNEDFGQIGIGGELVVKSAGSNTDGTAVVYPGQEAKVVLSNYSRLTSWSIAYTSASNASNATAYVHQGYLKLGTTYEVVYLLTPVLSCIPDGYSATVEVSVTAARYKTDPAQISISHTNATGHLSDSDFVGEVTAELPEAMEWGTKTLTLSGVSNADRIAIGPALGSSPSARLNVSEVSVVVKALEANRTPTNLSVSNTWFSETTLSWNVVSGADSYKVYKDGAVIATDLTELSYHVTELDVDTDYSFTVSSVTSGVESDQSEAVVAKTKNAWISAVERTAATFAWDATSTGTTSNAYVIEVYKDENLTQPICEKTFTAEPPFSQYSPFGASAWLGKSSGSNISPSTLQVSCGLLEPDSDYWFRVRPVLTGEDGSTFTYGSTNVSLTNAASGATWCKPVHCKTSSARIPADNEIVYCGFDSQRIGPDFVHRCAGISPMTVSGSSYTFPGSTYSDAAAFWTAFDAGTYAGEWFTWTLDRNYTAGGNGKLLLSQCGYATTSSKTKYLNGSNQVNVGTNRDNYIGARGDMAGWYFSNGIFCSIGTLHLAGGNTYISTPALTSSLLPSDSDVTCEVNVSAAKLVSYQGAYNTDDITLTIWKYTASTGTVASTGKTFTISGTSCYNAGASLDNYVTGYTPHALTAVEIDLRQGDAVMLVSSANCIIDEIQILKK